MARIPYRKHLIHAYIYYMPACGAVIPHTKLRQMVKDLHIDLKIIKMIACMWYLHAQSAVPKAGTLHLAWEHAIFQTHSNQPQTPVQTQLAVTLYRMGHFGNGGSVPDIARIAGISEGSVEEFTNRCHIALHSHHARFIRPLTDAEKEREKQWIEDNIGLPGWREGWIMYDGTIIVLYKKPGLNGDAYYTRKSNYGLNAQVQLYLLHLSMCIDQFVQIGSAHDASAFMYTAAGRWPEWMFKGNEFAWTDSAYTLTARTIPVHKKPASFQ
ncbi:hypothetical protein IW261DRAFT_1429065 [Armillaria novae-zelandiae]|uniref:DDE Tnp4 domain-containing protein n=1 Tax=Armillaria novae-zelandiae TaxID=153914 RepID=A0AA39KFY1_9AGAR|nr:hypothetical protein IW261DRAFT_1429065 [Armillaria novae-zelandiae]